MISDDLGKILTFLYILDHRWWVEPDDDAITTGEKEQQEADPEDYGDYD